MAFSLLRIFGSRNQRIIKQYQSVVQRINSLEEHMQPLSDEQLRAKTLEFRQRFTDGETLKELLLSLLRLLKLNTEKSIRLKSSLWMNLRRWRKRY